MMNGSTNSRTNSWREKNNNETEQSRAQWSTQSFTAEDIVQQFTLPQIVKCNQQAILVKREVPLPINLAQPLLLHDKRTIRKLLARNVVLDPATQRYSENDETVVIPSDYDGKYCYPPPPRIFACPELAIYSKLFRLLEEVMFMSRVYNQLLLIMRSRGRILLFL